MFNQTGGLPVPLNTFGGLVLEAPAVSLSEGSSPLNWDVDFGIGDVHTRPGLQSQLSSGEDYNFVWVQTFALQSGQIYTMALDSNGTLWREDVTNDEGTLVEFADVIFPGYTQSYLLQDETALGTTADSYKSITFPAVTTASTQTVIIGLVDVESVLHSDWTGPAGLTGYYISGSNQNDQVLYLGTLNGTATYEATISAESDPCTGVLGIFSPDSTTVIQSAGQVTGTITSTTTVNATLGSDVTQGSGLIAIVWAKGGSGASPVFSCSDYVGNKFLSIGSTGSAFSGYGPAYMEMFYAANKGNISDTVIGICANATNFEFVGIAVWEMSSLGKFISEATAFGTVADQRDYICFGQHSMPMQYDGTTIFDRISQEGPGGPVLVNSTATANPNLANITSYAVSSGVATFQASNSFSMGEIVQIALPGTPFTNTIAPLASASGTQFTISTSNGNVSSTPATGTATPINSFGISSITQPDAVNLNGKKIQWTSAPDANGVGTNLHIYYSSTQDADIAAAFAAGLPCYVYLANMPGSIPDGTYQITSIGKSQFGSNSYDYYFAVTMPSSAYLKTTGGASTTYQVTLATITLSSPMPGAVVGNQVNISGADPSAWDGSWTIVQAPSSGIFAITETSMDSSGNATYDYTLQSGNAPASGDLVTVTNTTNGDGIFNVVNGVITSTGTGYFVVQFPSYPTGGISSASETGQAEVSNNTFQIDPGPLFVGGAGTSSPIFGNDSSAGNIINTSESQQISSGTRQCVVLFLTQNNYLTRASAPVTFTVNSNTQSITVQNIPVGPPNVIARWIAFTEAGANGVPGAYFYVIPLPVKTIVNGQPYTYQPTVINDNVTTTATFSFVDAVLLSSLEIDIQGANQFNLVELGNSVWNIFYASRMFYGLEQNKITNFTNMSFQGGSYSTTAPFPTGWTQDVTNGAGGYLGTSSIWGQAYFIANTTGSTQDTYGMITQNAALDAYNVAIVQPNTLYSVRVTAGATVPGTGNLVVDMCTYNNANNTYGPVVASFSVPIYQLTSSPQIFDTTFMTTKLNPIPTNLVLRVYVTDITNDTIVEVDRIEVYPTDQPVNSTQLRVSYANNLEAFDSVTGLLGVATTNTQPLNGGFVMYDILYLLKQASMFSTQDTPNAEPANWDINEVSNLVGTCGPNSYDVGEEWMVTACRSGFYVFYGKQPIKLSQEIYPLWELINWDAAGTIWVRNDIVNRRILIGVPMSTPNAYLPNAATNVNPVTPNVVLMLNYLGLGDVMALGDGEQMHTTMFGTLMSVDMRRKWTIWQIPAPYADFILRSDGFSEPLFICNGINSGKIYDLSDTQYSDDGSAINGLYTTWGWSNPKEQGQTLLGALRKQWNYVTMTLSGSGSFQLSALRNRLNASGNFTYNAPPITLSTTPQDDYERPLNITGTKVFLQFSTNAVGAHFNLQQVIMIGKSALLAIRGNAAQ